MWSSSAICSGVPAPFEPAGATARPPARTSAGWPVEAATTSAIGIEPAAARAFGTADSADQQQLRDEVVKVEAELGLGVGRVERHGRRTQRGQRE